MGINLLDCTLRDGAYITDGFFGETVMRGIIKNLQDSNIEYIEVGWLKNNQHLEGTSYFNRPQDITKYLPSSRKQTTHFVAMLDYGRYDIDNLSEYDGCSIDTIRLVFPKEKFSEAIDFSKQIKGKGYTICLQAANTQSYSDAELLLLIQKANEVMPQSLSIVDTFGVMHSKDLKRIFMLLDHNLDRHIQIGFHSHNNLQLSYALSIEFSELGSSTNRDIIIDASLCGMGRGAGNTCTELITNYLNTNYSSNYEIDTLMDTIDIYMSTFINKFSWGYSIPYSIAGQLGSHVNNIAYLQNTHKISFRDMRMVLSLLSKDERKLYDYDKLEEKYIKHVKNEIDDRKTLETLRHTFRNKEILLIAPGYSVNQHLKAIQDFIQSKQPVVIGVNSILHHLKYDYLFFSNTIRYKYASEKQEKIFKKIQKLITSNIKTLKDENETIINYNALIQTQYKHFDNSTILLIRLLSKLEVGAIHLAGLDGFSNIQETAYSDSLMDSYYLNTNKKEIDYEINLMLSDFTRRHRLPIHFITDSQFIPKG